MKERIEAVRVAMLHLGKPLNGLASGIGNCDFDSCAGLLVDAKRLVEALEKSVSENPVANQLGTQIKRLSNAIDEAAALRSDSTGVEILKSAIIAVQAARSEFVDALDRLEQGLSPRQQRGQ
jgi:hypothetical protein